MVRKLGPQAYHPNPATVARNFGGWEAGLYRVREAGADRDKAMRVIRQRRAPVPLQPKRTLSLAW